MSNYLSSKFGNEVLGVMIVVLVVGLLLHYGMVMLFGPHDLNNMMVYSVHIVAIGAVSHVICELFGINHWYCKNGVACKV